MSTHFEVVFSGIGKVNYPKLGAIRHYSTGEVRKLIGLEIDEDGTRREEWIDIKPKASKRNL